MTISMVINDLLQLSLVAASVTTCVELVKRVAGTSRLGTQIIAIGLSLLGGALYYQFSANAAFWESALAVLVAANFIYEYLVGNFVAR